MKLQEFKNRFAANQTAFNQLFRRYRIKATGIDGIKEGHERFGEAFLMRAIDILNNHQPGQLSNLEDPKLEEEAYVDDIPFNTTQVVADFNLQNSANQKPGKFWEFFGNLFNAADQAAQSITNVKTAINNTVVKCFMCLLFLTEQKNDEN